MPQFQATVEGPQSRILIVDDSSFTRQLIAKVLVEAGFAPPLEAGDAAGALALIKKEKPDLVILDVDLGGNLDGIEVLHDVKRDVPGTKVVIVSALSQKLLEERVMAEQADAFILKPFKPQQLLFAVGMALGYDVF